MHNVCAWVCVPAWRSRGDSNTNAQPSLAQPNACTARRLHGLMGLRMLEYACPGRSHDHGKACFRFAGAVATPYNLKTTAYSCCPTSTQLNASEATAGWALPIMQSHATIGHAITRKRNFTTHKDEDPKPNRYLLNCLTTSC